MNQLFRVLVACIVLLSGATLAVAKPMALPGSNWTLDLPDGFTIEQKVIPSFVNKAGTMIVVFDAPPQPMQGMALPKVGDISDVGTDNESKLEALEAVVVDGKPGWLLQQRFAKQKSIGLTLLVEGKSSNANVVTRITDEQAKTVTIAELRGLFLSLREKILSEAERVAALPFVVKDTSGFTIAGIVGNAIVVFSDGPEKNVDKAPQQASVTVALSPPGPSDISPEMLAIFDKQGMLDGLMTHQFPGAVGGVHKPLLMGETPALSIPYTRTLPAGGPKLAGEVRFLLAGRRLLMVYSSHPEGDAAKASSVQRLVDSVALKPAAQ